MRTQIKQPVAAAMLAAAGVFAASASAGVQQAVEIKMQCHETFAAFPVSFAVARDLVPAEYEVVQFAPGTVILWLPLQDCSSLEVNGEDIGRTPLSHAWIPVVGPQEVVTVPGYGPAYRDYFYSIAEHTTKNLARQLAKQIGYEGHVIESLTLGTLIPTTSGYGVRAGGVVEKAFGNDRSYGYRWVDQVFPVSSAGPIVHTYYHTKNAGKKGETDVRCGVARTGEGYIQLTVDPRSELAVLGTTLLGQSVDLTMECSATMRQFK